MLDAHSPSAVSFEGTVVGEDAVVSPISGVRAAVVRVTLLSRRPVGKHPETGDPFGLGGGGGPETFTRIGDVWLGATLVLVDGQGNEIVVETAGLAVRTATTARAIELGAARPAELAEVLASAPEGRVFYRELFIGSGSRVKLKATVAPIAARRWQTRADSGPVVLELIRPGLGATTRPN